MKKPWIVKKYVIVVAAPTEEMIDDDIERFLERSETMLTCETTTLTEDQLTDDQKVVIKELEEMYEE